MNAEKVLQLFHTGFLEIKEPDINYGRKNADFGGGFYLSDSLDFAQRWAKERAGKTTYVNFYTLDLTGLKVKRFEKNGEWFDYILKNRAGYEDKFSDYDVIIGPIAPDTLYDTYGIITSGLLKPSDALGMMSLGKEYYQINLKSEKAVLQLKWLSSRVMNSDELSSSRQSLRSEEAEFQKLFISALEKLPEYDEIKEILS